MRPDLGRRRRVAVIEAEITNCGREPMPDLTLKPIHRIDGYLPIEDYGLIGDGTTAALIGRDSLCLNIQPNETAPDT